MMIERFHTLPRWSCLLAAVLALSSSLRGQETAVPSPEKASAPTPLPDDLQIAVQKICPVCGEPLNSSTESFPTAIGERGQIVYVCSLSCKSSTTVPRYWSQMLKHIADAQKECPVMGEELPEDPGFVVVDGKTIFICCPPCGDEIQAEPQKFLPVVADHYRRSLNPPQAMSSEELQIEIQQICPVSGEKLGAHGTPVKVEVGEQGQEVYLCCAACAERDLNQTHWETIHRNFASAQGVCPIMNKPLPEGCKSTVVRGKIIFVCCPPCIAKIDAAPDTALQAVEQHYRERLAGGR